ncbi:Kae1-associated serine/threonine protein kinase [Candidatus Woesearchaeota archaeon]|nr:Kae1-associated serine/threonine protein kinase [Candidatus Woesearchaeota archaeon]
MKELSRGAEAAIYIDGNTLIKDRIKKTYRINEIDIFLRSSRTNKEARLLEKSSSIINVPKVIETKNERITMEFIKGDVLRDIINNMPKKELILLCRDIGRSIKSIHDKDIIHGDLTTSNMILKSNNLYFIDFGLGFISSKIEDKAVDLHLLRQALYSKHYEIADFCFKAILNAYGPSNEFLERFSKVESRGRYKHKPKIRQKS